MTGPARPYRVINNFVVSKPRDFSEDLSGKSAVLALTDWSPVLLRIPRGWTSHLFYLLCLGQEDKQPRQLGGGGRVPHGVQGRGSGIGEQGPVTDSVGSQVLEEVDGKYTPVFPLDWRVVGLQCCVSFGVEYRDSNIYIYIYIYITI